MRGVPWQAAAILAWRLAHVSDPLIRELDHYVVLEPGVAEQMLTALETRHWLMAQLQRLPEVPADLAHMPGPAERAERLLQTACELELEPGVAIQWFAIRLEPPES
jgi:hypothetical protein